MQQDSSTAAPQTLKALAARIRIDSSQMRSSDVPLPSEINADTIEVFEAGLGVGTNYTLLYPVGPVDFNIRRVALPLDQVFDPEARQVEVLARTLHTLAEGHLRVRTATSRRRLYLDIVLHALDQLPMGGEHLDEWLQRDAQGLPLLHWLELSRSAVRTLTQRFTIPVPLERAVYGHLDSMAQQIEQGFARPAPSDRPPAAAPSRTDIIEVL